MSLMRIPKALSIAGSDGSGGAGIQADLKVFSALGCYGMAVPTAIAVQNTMGVRACYALPIESITGQVEAIFDDIIPDAIKIGMLFDVEIIQQVSRCLNARRQHVPIVLDPVMVAKSGDALLRPDAVDALKAELLPIVSVVTPNIPEAEVLTGRSISCADDMLFVAAEIIKMGVSAVLLKGGHAAGDVASDVLMTDTGRVEWFDRPRIDTKNTHGTGCSLSSALAAFLAHGFNIFQACALAKEYLYSALKAGADLNIGSGHGPVHHFHALWPHLKITALP